MRIFTLALAAVLTSTLVHAGDKVTFIKGKSSIFSGKGTFLLELDLATTSIDALNTEADFIEFNKNKKEKKDKNSGQWETDWNNDKKSFLTTYTEVLAKATKNSQLKFSQDDPDSKYRMVLTPVHIETGNAMKYSAVEMKIHVYDMASNEEVAVIHIVPSRGAQMGPMTPTVGQRVNMAMYGSASMLASAIKKTQSGKK